jgi:D-alanyl-D-alanine dipeptidase
MAFVARRASLYGSAMSVDPLDLKRRPVPSSAEALARKAGYRQTTPIDFDGELADEPCVEARDAGLRGANHYNTADNPPYYLVVPGSLPQLYLRRSVADRLVAVNKRLEAIGVELFLFDAWRPQAIQRFFHDVWFPDWLRARHPNLEGDALRDEVEKYWAAPTSGPTSPSPHSTAAAVDLTLVFRESGQPLFMGGLFDDLTEDAWTDGFERRPVASMSDEEARANRRLLYWAMTEAGFANNPTEWWHYSWGDQMWAKMTGQAAAFYPACDPAGLDPA